MKRTRILTWLLAGAVLGAQAQDTVQHRGYVQAAIYEKQGRYQEALPLYQEELARLEKRMGAEDPAVAALLNALAGPTPRSAIMRRRNRATGGHWRSRKRRIRTIRFCQRH